MNNFLPTGAATSRFTPSMFLTPQGNVYIIDSALEVANVPMGTGVSVAICPTENLMRKKRIQVKKRFKNICGKKSMKCIKIV